MRGLPERIIRCCRGSVVTEFAFLAPVALVMLFGAVETGRIYWMKQTLNEVAYATARCTSVSSACDTTAHQQAYAVSRAAGYALTIQAANVTVTGATTCRTLTQANQVTIVKPVTSALRKLLPFVPAQLSATACFPVVS